MGIEPQDTSAHPSAVQRLHERLLIEANLSSSMVRTSDGARVHVAEQGSGPPVVFVHGSGSPGSFWLPLLPHLEGMRAVVVDRPGFGLSDPPPATAMGEGWEARWLDMLLDALALPAAILVGHSMGGLWSLRFTLKRPERVVGLALIAAPGLPGTRAMLPFRLMGTPGVRSLIERQRETPRTVAQFAKPVSEGDSLRAYPELVELMVAVGNDPIAARSLRAEIRALVAPWALATRTGFRRRARVREEDLHEVAVPTLLVWGEHDPLGGSDVARTIQSCIPGAELALVPGGHAPWLGSPHRVASVLSEWVKRVRWADAPS
ncbi:alpha/beta hydrolase [Agrococcus sp. ProA11]|uniref:alpha/beta fold hydrolase n=1 Tax=Agrococcus chionoecetis TaxID=3153752 RepID=UPI003260215E